MPSKSISQFALKGTAEDSHGPADLLFTLLNSKNAPERT
jgi:hypothetical protein